MEITWKKILILSLKKKKMVKDKMLYLPPQKKGKENVQHSTYL